MEFKLILYLLVEVLVIIFWLKYVGDYSISFSMCSFLAKRSLENILMPFFMILFIFVFLMFPFILDNFLKHIISSNVPIEVPELLSFSITVSIALGYVMYVLIQIYKSIGFLLHSSNFSELLSLFKKTPIETIIGKFEEKTFLQKSFRLMLAFAHPDSEKIFYFIPEKEKLQIPIRMMLTLYLKNPHIPKERMEKRKYIFLL